MSDEIETTLPNSFWVYSGGAFAWNLIGLFAFYTYVTTPLTGNPAFTAAQQEFLASTPAWATGAYGVAVITGVLGSLSLLMRKRWAVPLFIISLVAVIIQDIHGFVISNAIEVWGTGAMVMPTVVLIVGIALIFYSRTANAKGWLN